MKINLQWPVIESLVDDLVRLKVLARGRDKQIIWSSWGRHTFNKNGNGVIDLSAMTRAEVGELQVLLQKSRIQGTAIVAADLRKYLKAGERKGADNLRARNGRQAAWMLEHYVGAMPHHMIFNKQEYGTEVKGAYYVGDVIYHPEEKTSRDHIRPEYLELYLWYIDKGWRRKKIVDLERGDFLERTPEEILNGKGYVSESPQLMNELRIMTDRYYALEGKYGRQMVAKGIGVLDIDNALTGEIGGGRYNRRSIQLDKFGSARVVVDVMNEREDTEDKDRESRYPDPYRWHKWNLRFNAPSEDDVIRHMEADEDTAEPVDYEIPVHPLLPVFDLNRHIRMRVHVANLVPYEYDRTVAERLILPERDIRMVNLLVDQTGNQFQDIVSDKGRSMNVLATGKPGVGKTLTAEVFAEFKAMPLYTVQCAQLGLNATEVQSNLELIIDRADRWNAILLLDEADVYVRARGTNLTHNAIVGAFLRVLEYATSILFMTSNLGDEIDDAIASRCIARLHYEPPSVDDQCKIWRVLAELNGFTISDKEVRMIAENNPSLTGRDVKNLLKLASFTSNGSNVITFDRVEYAKQFKPTAG